MEERVCPLALLLAAALQQQSSTAQRLRHDELQLPTALGDAAVSRHRFVAVLSSRMEQYVWG